MSTVLLCLLGACASLSDEEIEKLDTYKRNAITYLQGEEFQRALQQTELGLEIDGDDYALLATRALARGFLAGDVFARLTAAEPLFDEVYELREPTDQQPLFLIEFAKIKQRIAAEQRRQSERARAESREPGLTESEREQKLGRAKVLAEESVTRSDEAETALLVLIERQELVRTANRVLMAITAERGDVEGAIGYATEAIDKLQEQKNSLIETIEKDNDLRRTLRARQGLEGMLTEEKLIRSRLSSLYFGQEEYALAIQQLDVILELDPNRSFDYYNRAVAHEALGNRSRAVDDFQSFLSTTDLPASDEKVRHAYDYIQTLP